MGSAQDDDMYLFQGGLDQTPGAFAGQDFDNFLETSPSNNDDVMTEVFMNPNDLTIKRERADASSKLTNVPRSSRSSASSSSSSTSAFLKGNGSTATSTTSPGKARKHQSWGSGINGFSMPAGERYFDDASMSGLDPDFEDSNQQMATAFDFDTAASTPSGFDAASMMTMRPNPTIQPYRRVATMGNFQTARNTTPRAAGNHAHFFLGSREASPLSAMLPTTSAQSPWTKHSPSSGLEETFNHITVNGDSPGNGTLSPTMQFNSNGFSFDADYSGTPTSFHKDMTSPPSTIISVDGSSHLTVYPTSLKSRVETQIPIKMVLYPLPQGAKKLRLPTHTVSKPKFLAKPEVDRSPEVLELYTSLVCTSAMQDSYRLERALARARGEDLTPYTKPSPASSSGSHNSSRDDEEKPLNGGEVRICSGCIQRERKRASRKKQKKPDEEEMFQKDEEKRVVVFNTSEIKDWVEVTKENQPTAENIPTPPPGAMQVELPMRIACYCRHQNEKMGFQVIFTIKDFRDKVIAQAMTNSIMITDDHKTHNAPPAVSNAHMAQMSTGPQLPGAGVFSTSGMEMPAPQTGAKLFKQSFSTTDLHGLQHNFNPNFPMTPTANPFAIPGNMSAVSSGTMTPRILSRPASPSGPSGPTSKRRKQSGSGKLPTGLTMTRLDTASNTPFGSATVPNTAASSPYAPNMASFMNSERAFQVPPRPQMFSTSPPTPNGNDGAFPASINRSFSLENIPRQTMMSAPASRHPSRPSSPRTNSNRNSFGASDSAFGQAVANGLMGHGSRRPPPIIHKLVPAEGSVTGGTEVTLLGNGFYQGLEVMFGDTEATTTTFWGEKCLNCIAPPAQQAGIVAVVFKHDHPQYSNMQQQSQTRLSVFTYVDDREIELLRLALRTLGKTMPHPTDDPYSAAQQLLQQNQQTGMWGQQNMYGMGGGHQRQMSGLSQMESLRLESDMLNMLQDAKSSSSTGRVRFDLRSDSGMTLLHLACSMGMNRFAFALLSAGADPNLVDKSGNTAMHHAAMYGHEQIIDSLRSAGGDHRIRSIRNFMPADFATTLASHQATSRPYQHSRVRSAGASLRDIRQIDMSTYPPQYNWNNSSTHEDHDNDNLDDESLIPEDEQSMHMPFAQEGLISSDPSRALSKRESGQLDAAHYNHPISLNKDEPGPSKALLQAWRQLANLTNLQQQQLADQVQALQDSVNRMMPHLSPQYQEIPVVQRMSLMFPQQPTIDLTPDSANLAPPAYDELYPNTATSPDPFLKKSSTVQAAVDAALDLHFEQKSTAKSVSGGFHFAKSARFTTYRDLMEDKKAVICLIPLLVIVVALVLHNSNILQAVNMRYDQFDDITNRHIAEAI